MVHKFSVIIFLLYTVVVDVLQATFDPEVFFNVILPPIIFNAGFSMKKVSVLLTAHIC